jgi:ankyrin repeat protein
LLCETTPKGIKTILTELENISKSSADGEERKRRALDHAYEAAMRRIQSQPSGHYELAKRVLSWIVCAKQDLSPLQLQHAVAIEINSRTLDEDNIADIGLSISVCAGLMTIHKESNVVKPVHYTTQEYFERTWQDWFPDSYVYLTKACITYISLQVFDSGECASKDDLRDRYEDYPFYQYSGQHWGSYAKDTSMETDPLVLDLLQSTTRLAAITQTFQVVFYEMDYSTGYTTEMNGLHVAAHFGLYESLSILLGGTLDIDSKDRVHHRSSLFWAANHKEVVNLLLDSGADIEFQDRRQLTPLIHAAGKGHKSVVQLLIDRGANINSENSFHDTPLTSAITQRHEDVAMLLVNSEVDFQSKTGHESSLNSAVRYGLEGLVRLILTKGVDVNSKNGSGETPLFAAIRYQRKSLVELLLHRAADVNSKSNSGCTPLFQAIMYEEDLSVLRLLLQHGADTNPEYDDSNLLEFAIWHGRTDVVRLFLHEGICLDSPGRALANAAEAGHVEPVKLLLDAGTDIESRSTYNKTWDEAANMFTMRTSFNQTALSLAARNGRQDVVRLLLDRGADIESKNTYGFNPLCLAVLNGDESMARLLLSGGAQIESRAGSSQTPLLLAASQGFEEIVELLLSLNAQVEARDIHGFTPLILAATEGHYFVVQLILEHGARVNARANEGQTALLQAIARSHVDVVGLLLKRGANLKMNGLQKRVSPLGLALEKGKKPIVSLIRKKLSEISSSTDTGSESGSENPASTSLLKTGTSLGSSSKNTSQTSLSRSSQGPGGSKSGMALVLADPNSDTDSSAAYEKRGSIQAPRRHASNFLDPNLHVKSPRPASYSHSRQESAGTHSSSTRPRRRRRRRHDKETGVGERSNSIHSDGEETSQTLEGKSTGTDGSKRVRDAQTRPQRKLFGIFRVK